MTLAGWILLLASWVAIGTLVVFCMGRVLRAGPLSGGSDDEEDRPQRP